MASADELAALLNVRFPGSGYAARALVIREGKLSDQFYIRVDPSSLIEVLTFLRDDAASKFEQIIDLTCVDYLHFPNAVDRYGVNYSLLSITHGHRLWIKCYVNDPEPRVPSAVGVWAGANWMEREVFDMFGVIFDGHPDLRRILTWDDFEAHPLRKDYPLRGRGEREDYKMVTRESA
ncbi:MAG TPA: NADH-quinone oxidoreductase subunit C [Phycisphaerae bacterium]|nr:NADH-quinone oxidoreductase subunit C [Phycisphaerae bacterium]